MTETQLRFLRAIADRVGAERVVEVRLFPSLKQGGVESGVAIVAAEDAATEVAAVAFAALEEPAEVFAEDREVPLTRTMGIDDLVGPADLATPRDESDAPRRYAFLTAWYRLTIKGQDRGKWEFDVRHEADTPLPVVDQVVSGVLRRAGDDGEASPLSGQAFRNVLLAPIWEVVDSGTRLEA